MSYINVVNGAYIDYEGGRWRFECRQDHGLEWRNVRTFEHLLLTDIKVQLLIRDGKLVLFDGIGRKPVEGKTSIVHGKRAPTEADWEEARRKLLFVEAIHDAGIFEPGASVSDWEAVIDIVFQAHGAGWTMLRGRNKGGSVSKPSYKSVRRWVIDGGRNPTLQKMLPRHRHKGNYGDRLHPNLRRFIAERVQRDYLKRPAINIETLQTIIHIEMKELNEKREASGLKPFTPPGLTAIQSSIDAVPQDEVLRRRYGDMAAFLEFGSAEAQADPTKPLERVELDATPMDLFLIDPDTGLPIGRPTLVVALDRCTRMVLGWFVTFEKPSVLALMQCLRNAILAKDYVGKLREGGWNIVNDPETFGVPRKLVLDRGRENIAEHVARFAKRVGINRVVLTAGKSPWLKGAVERVIKTINEAISHPTPGTTLHNVLMRMDYDSEKDAVCAPADLDYGLHKYFIDIYPFEQRRSLNNRQPIKLWRTLTRKYPVDSVGRIEDVAHLFGRTQFAKPGRHGINYENLQYFSTELLEMQRLSVFQKALAKQGGKLEFHADPADLGRIHVHLPHREGDTIVVPVASKWTKYATGLSLWHHRRIREFADKESLADAAALLQAKYDLIQIMKGSATAKRGGLRARGMGARMEGIMRVARAGDDAANTVEGSAAHPDQMQPDMPAAEDRSRNTQGDQQAPDETATPTPTSGFAAAPSPVAAPPAANDTIDQHDVVARDDVDPDLSEIEEEPIAPRRVRKGYRP